MATVLTAADDTHSVKLTLHHEDEPWIVGGGPDWMPALTLFLDEDGTATLAAVSCHNSDNGTLFSVHHGRDQEWRRCLTQGSLAVADPERIKEIGEAVLPLLLHVHAGLDTYWDGSNMRGLLSDDAQAAAEAVSALLGDPWTGQDGMAWQSDEWTALAAADETTARAHKVLLSGSTLNARRAACDELREQAEEA